MGKRQLLAKQRKRNIYTGDPIYDPYPNLKFRHAQTEAHYQTESFRFSKTSLRCCSVFGLFVAVVLWLKGYFTFIQASLSLLSISLGLHSIPYGPLAVRLFWTVFDAVFASVFAGNRLSQCFTALFPSFAIRKTYSDLFTVKHWSYFLLFSLGESVFACFLGAESAWKLVEVAFGLTFVTALFEREGRDLWVMFDSYRKSEALHHKLFSENPSAVFIVTSLGKVIEYNIKAKKLVKKLNKPIKILHSGSFQDLFAEEFTTRFKDLIAAAMRGEEEEEELFLKPLPSKLDADVLCDLAISVRFQPTIWKSGNCVRVTCSDISPFMSRRLFLMHLYKGVYGSIYTFLRSLQRLYQCSEIIQTEDMYKYNKIASTLKNALVLQSYFLGRIELKKESYHIKNEISAQVEFASVKAEEQGVTLSVSKDASMPLSVIGDRNKHNQLLSILLDFALEQAIQGSEEYDEEQPLALYRVAFRSSKITQIDLDKLLSSRKKEGTRKTLQEIVGITANYGVGLAIFDTLLAVLRGCVKDAYAAPDGFDQKVVIAYEYLIFRIPLLGVTQESLTPPPTPHLIGVRTKFSKVEKTKSDPPFFGSIQKSSDESQMLHHQIHRLKVGKSVPTIRGLPVLSRSTDSFAEYRKRSSMDSVAEVLSVEEDFKEDEIVEFSGHTVEQAIRTHAPYASTNTHSVLRLPTEVYTYRSATSSRIRSKRRICSKRNPAAGTFEDYRSPLEEIRIKVFTSTTSGTVNLNLEQGPLKVLLVEDNKFTREAIKIQLSKETGCEPDLARDGSEALEVFSSYANQGHMYFIIFMDVVMPKMDGYQATSAIRRLEQEKGYRRTYICGMSGTQEQTEEKYKAAGMNFFGRVYLVKKPLQETQIMQIFEDARNAGKIAI